MSKFTISSSFLYRYRYVIGYALIGIILASLMVVAAFLIPAGLTAQAENSIIISSQMTLSELWHNAPLHAPFYLAQHGMLSLFGVSLLGVKLVSIILGLITALGMILLLRQWFSHGVSVLASLLAVTTGQFLFLTQQGTISVLYLFWPVAILLLATLVARRVKHSRLWMTLLFVSIALSLYTPLSIYVLIALASAALLHPHLRYVIRKLPRTQLTSGLIVATILLLPLVITCIKHPTHILQLLGAPSEWSASLLSNFSDLAYQYFGFLSLGNSSVILPVFGLGSMLIILCGLYRTTRSFQSVQSYIILVWLILLLPVLVINPLFISITFVPLLLLLATGLEHILHSWYDVFPFNPYARIAGLIPLVVLVGGLIIFGLERYSYGYRYAPEIVQNFSQDALIVPDVPVLTVTDEEKPLYEAIARYRNGLSIVTKQPEKGTFAVTAAAYTGKRPPGQIITVGSTRDGARFYIYK